MIVGDSQPIRGLRALIEAVAPTRLPVLIQGPTGSGKELVAAALHAGSQRRGNFVPFNVCAVSESMFEDALFGHVRGAFTGAVHDVPGFLREADGGTVFLDEVSGLPPALQAKLLRAMETGVFRPVGVRCDAQSDFRLVAASNERLECLVDDGRFRADFAHRVGAVTIDVPPLAYRLEDVPLLVRHFLDSLGRTNIQTGADAIDLLCTYHWPGNVRELRHVVEWSAAFSNGQLNVDSIRSAIERRKLTSLRRHDSEALRRQTIRNVLEQHDWNAERAAQELGIHRATLYRRMKRLGVVPADLRDLHVSH